MDNHQDAMLSEKRSAGTAERKAANISENLSKEASEALGMLDDDFDLDIDMPLSPDASRFDAMTDEEIIACAHAGDRTAEEYMLLRYKNFVRSKARSYFLIGADREDIIQEGMFGLFKAIRDYKPDRLASFHVFAELCITRQIITAIKTATRQKHIPLNSYISLNKPLYEDENDHTLLDVIV